jgi:hypothetical protein
MQLSRGYRGCCVRNGVLQHYKKSQLWSRSKILATPPDHLGADFGVVEGIVENKTWRDRYYKQFSFLEGYLGEKAECELRQFITDEISAAEKRGVELERENRKCYTCERLDRLLAREKETNELDNWYRQMWKDEHEKSSNLTKALKKIIQDNARNCLGIAAAALKSYEEGR